MIVSWQDVRHMHHLMRAPLRWHHNTTNLFHLRIVRWTHSVQVASNLTTYTTCHMLTQYIQ